MNVRTKQALWAALFPLSMACAPTLSAGTTADSIEADPMGANAAEENPLGFTISDFSLFETAGTEITLPFSATAGGAPMEVNCLKKAASEQWDTEDPRVVSSIAKVATGAKASLLKWVQQTLTPPNFDADKMADWSVDIDKVTVRNVAPDLLRMDEVDTCLDATTKKLRADVQMVTTAFGVKQVIISSESGMKKRIANIMKRKGKSQGLKVSSQPAYERAVDDKGNPIREKNKRMFIGPAGKMLPGNELPKNAMSLVKSVTIEIQEGVFFAYGDMPNNFWTNEMVPGQCSINLIFDDPTPRIPDCPALKDIGFGVSEGDSNNTVIVKAATNEDEAQVIAQLGETVMLQVGGRAIAWITADHIPQGAIFKVDSMVLRASETKRDDLVKFSFK